MGPIDYLIVEWPGRQPTGEALPHLIDLVDRGLIRILDLAFIAKAEDGSVAALEIADLGDEIDVFAAFEGASSGLLGDDDIARPATRSSPAPRPPCSSSRTAGRGRSPPPCAAPAASWSPAAASPSKTSSPRSTRSRHPSKRRPPCQDYFEEWRARRSSPAPRPPSATASRAARASAGPSRKNRSSRPPPRGAAPPAPAAGGQSTIDQLKQLGELKAQGILTEEEFAAQKAKLLNA